MTLLLALGLLPSPPAGRRPTGRRRDSPRRNVRRIIRSSRVAVATTGARADRCHQARPGTRPSHRSSRPSPSASTDPGSAVSLSVSATAPRSSLQVHIHCIRRLPPGPEGDHVAFLDEAANQLARGAHRPPAPGGQADHPVALVADDLRLLLLGHW